MAGGRMSVTRQFPILSLITVLAFLAGCKSTKPSNSEPSAVTPNSRAVTQRQIPDPDKAQLLQDVKDLPPSGDEVIEGTRRFNGWFFKANKITFKSGSVLLFTKQAQANRRQFFVIAREIDVEDASNPGKITWEKGDIPAPPSSAGEAPAGADGGENSAGAPGAPGGPGTKGYDGPTAPSVVLITMRVPSSGPLVDLTGQDGSQGGMGQQGGKGGKGGTGNSASQNAFNCNRGAGNGGPGGSGGLGGQGGKGGTGGDGGVFTLISTTENLPNLTQKFRILYEGGHGGIPGQGGLGGVGGHGGDGGAQQLPYCSGNGSPGPTGNTGNAGAVGTNGDNGKEGDYTVGGISQAQFSQYVWK
jgi:hypothetical protein